MHQQEYYVTLEKQEGYVTEHGLWTDDWICLGEACATSDTELQLVTRAGHVTCQQMLELGWWVYIR